MLNFDEGEEFRENYGYTQEQAFDRCHAVKERLKTLGGKFHLECLDSEEADAIDINIADNTFDMPSISEITKELDEKYNNLEKGSIAAEGAANLTS